MKVSVIVPVYNASKYLRKCLDSILEGSLKDIEVIAVNDGSTDNSLSILQEYESRYCMRVLSQRNSGPARARNTGLDVAEGEYIGFVDSDDWVEPDMFEKMYQTAKVEDADIVFCNVMRNNDIRLRKYLANGVYDCKKIRDQIYPLLISNIDETSNNVTLRGSTCLRIFKRELINHSNIRFDEGLVYNEDGLFCISATLRSSKYVYLGDSYLYHNRFVPGSLTKRFVPNLWARQRIMGNKLKELSTNVDYDFSRQIDKKMMEIGIYCVENICKDDNPADHNQRIDDIRQIISSRDIKEAVKSVSFHKLKNINKLYWLSFMLRSPRLAMMTAHHRMKK